MLVYNRNPYWLNARENASSTKKSAHGTKACFRPATNIIERNNDYSIEVMLPGFDKKEVVIDIDKNQLQISSTKKIQMNENERSVKTEFENGSFKRKFELPDTVDTDNIKASLKNGILAITLPKLDHAKAKPAREVAIA